MATIESSTRAVTMGDDHQGPRRTVSWRRALWPALAMSGVLASSACVVETDDGPDIEPRDGELQIPPPVSEVPAPLPGAHCEIQVTGQGLLDMENDYLPHVIQCENGGANLEALKAQAIAARSVAYYAIETSGSICDGQGCQVYGCGATPSALHHQAVDETSGVYLMYNNHLTYGFYVAGDNSTSPPSCVGVSGSTEGWVTYNEGLSGASVDQTALGLICNEGSSCYGQNRGCMSQWGARCLENDNGYDYLGILRFYYGDDIILEQGEGACVLPGEGTTTGDPPATTGPMGGTTDVGPVDSSGAASEGPGVDTEIDPPLPGGTASGSEGSGGGSEGGLGGDNPALPTTFGANDDVGGCSCRSTGDRSSDGAWWLLGALGLGLGRRRR